MATSFKPNFDLNDQILNLVKEVEKNKAFNAEDLSHPKIMLNNKSESEAIAYETAIYLTEESINSLLTKDLLKKINKLIVKDDKRIADSEFQIIGGEVWAYSQIIYRSANYSEQEIDKLLDWVNDPSIQINPLIKAGIARYKFLKIHPFLGGNGRTAKLLARVILRQNNYSANFCNALENYFETYKLDHYAALDFRSNIKEIENYDLENTNDLTKWVEYFCRSALNSFKNN